MKGRGTALIEITDIIAGSPADKAGIRAGDCLIAVNDTVIHDVLDYRFAVTAKQLTVRFLRDCAEQEVSLRKGEYEDTGLCFATALMDEKRTCGNHCIFCFIDQNPKGMRDTIYFKDDDARLSFLQGSYITLTNLTDEDVDRIIKMHMTVNVSVQTTEPDLRNKMLGNKKAGESLRHLWRMGKAGVSMNCQIVLCPTWNDGDHLHKTLADLFSLVPAVESIAVVPFGMTKFRQHLCPIPAFTVESAREAVEQIEAVQRWSLQANGRRIVYASDELYLLANLPLPDDDAYEGYPQYENGVGMLRYLMNEFYDALEDAEYDGDARFLTIATGSAAAPFLDKMMRDLEAKFPQVHCQVITVYNDFYGHTVTVAGLLTFQDLRAQLKGKALGSAVLLTETCLRHDDVFLDDRSREDLEKALGVPVIKCKVDGYVLLDTVLGLAAGE
ncbi:MAG TPA: radical SAM protein [Ruminococcus sp.]|nr:radical SAM protein [Ruminococcus sp.]